MIVLIVEDDRAVREALGQTLELADLEVVLASSFVAAKDIITPGFTGIIVSDIRMPGRDGLYLLEYAHGIDPDLPVILLTGEGDIPMAVAAMARGAFDFLEKPCPADRIVATVNRAIQSRGAVLKNRRVVVELAKGDPAARMLFGDSDKAEALRTQARQIARIDGPVLIEGPPGSGVSKVAEVVHLLSTRNVGPFEKRATPGMTPDALAQALTEAEGGSLFLSEVTDLPADAQFALLEALETGTRTRVLAGSTAPLSPNAAGMNADLFYRLEALRLRIPALRDRPEDIPVLFRHYVAQACEQAGIPERAVGGQTVADLMAQDWPGNARSLMNAAMRFALGVDEPAAGKIQAGLSERMAQIEASLLIDALRDNGGNASNTAAQLKLPRKTFYDKLARHGIRAEDYR